MRLKYLHVAIIAGTFFHPGSNLFATDWDFTAAPIPGGPYQWLTGSNWVGGVAPNGPSDFATISEFGSGAFSVEIASPVQLLIWALGINNDGSPITFSGSQFTSVATIDNNGSSVTISSDIELNVAGPRSAFSSGVEPLVLSGVISESIPTGVEIQGTGGIVEFSGAVSNSYSGETILVNGAFFQLNKTAAIAVPSQEVMINNSTLTLLQSNQINPLATITNVGEFLTSVFDLNGQGQTVDTVTMYGTGEFGEISFNGGGTLAFSTLFDMQGRATVNSGGTLQASSSSATFSASNLENTINSAIDLNTQDVLFRVFDSSLLTVFGTISNGSLSFIGQNGVLELASPNTYAGTTNIVPGGSGGAIRLLNNTALGTSTLMLTHANAILELTNGINMANTVELGSLGSIFVDLGSLATLSGSLQTGTFHKTGFGTLRLSGSSTMAGQFHIDEGMLAIDSASAIAGPEIQITATGIFSFNQNAITISNNMNMLADGAIVDVPSGQTDTISGIISGSQMTKIGAGTLILSGNNAHRGNNITAGTVVIGNQNSLGNPSYTTSLANATTLQIGNITSIINPFNLINGSTTFYLDTGFVSNPTFGGGGVISGPGGLIKTGSTRTLIMEGNNTFQGGVQLNEGSITLAHNNGLGTGTLTMADTTTLNLNPEISSINAISLTGTGIISIDSLETGSLGGVISGSILQKTGLGTLILSNANGYTGGTSLNSGIIDLQNNAGLGTGTLTMADNTTLNLNNGIIPSNAITLTATGAINTATGVTGSLGGAISGSILQKTGPGTLILSNANGYSGGTSLSSGTIDLRNTTGLGSGDLTMTSGSTLILGAGINPSNNGNLNNNSTIDVASGTSSWEGSLTGTGATPGFHKTGGGTLALPASNTGFSGASAVDAGILNVNGSIDGAGTFLIASGAQLTGTGTITQDMTLQGMLSPGNSIGTITLTGSQIFDTGSIVEIEINPTQNDLIIINGDLTINAGSTLSLLADPGVYSLPFSVKIIDTTAGITGAFSTFISSLPLFSGSLTYQDGDAFIMLSISSNALSDFFKTGNAGAVASCLDGFLDNPCGNSQDILNVLASMSSLSEIKAALLQMQPSFLTSLAVAQQNTALYVRNAVYQRLNQPMHAKCANDLGACGKVNVWMSALGGHTAQKNRGDKAGYIANSPGAFIGADTCLNQNFIVGGSVGYTYDHLHWQQDRGEANAQTAYLGFYGRWSQPHFYLQGSVLGGYSFYDVKRFIQFGFENAVDYTAKSKFHGWDSSAHAMAGLDYTYREMDISPFVALDYLYTYEEKFTESGAESLNLRVKEYHADVLASEAGVDLSHCYKVRDASITPYVRGSVVYESRFTGKKHNAAFICGNCSMKVSGLYPSRILGTIATGFDATIGENVFSLNYQARIAEKYNDQSLYVNFLRKF